jgi:hypothetical protein
MWFVACAQDAGIDTPGSGGKSDAGQDGPGGTGGQDGGFSGSDGGWPTTGFGAPCTKDADCAKGSCIDIGQHQPNQVCVWPCDTNPCPSGAYCGYDPAHGYLCLPDTGNQCAICQTDAECPNVGDRCTPSPNIDRFCARDCSFDGTCPAGFTCVAPAGYPPGKPASDAGAPDSGAIGDAAPPKAAAMCVPANNESCPCDAKRDGVKRLCTSKSGSITCEGTETCNGTSKAWEGCTAGSPQPEVCDGADNDCNGTPDDAPADTLCAAKGTPAHGKWACNFGSCEVGSCDAGWAVYPPSSATQGCTCAIDAGEPNDTCANATDGGSVTDANTTAVTLKGTLSSDADVDWWKFSTVDSDETTTNSYHIKMVFSAPASNSEFVFDVIRGDTCATPDAKHSELTSYDWCVDGTGSVGGKAVGEKACGATAAIHCGPHSKSYLVRVRRKAGTAGTCTQYALTVTAKGGGTCDFTQACDPQIDENL